MPHMLETDSNGTTYFADARNDAWHQLGQQVGHAMTADELMTESHLGGWNVRKIPAFGVDGPGPLLPVIGKFAIVRDNPTTGQPEAMGGMVGNHYVPIQNETNTEVLQALVDQSGALFETAGSLNGGRNVFVTMKMPENLMVGGRDELELYIAAMNSHDGTSRYNLITSPVRIVCKNTQDAAVRGAKSSFQISHTSGATNRIEEARQALALTWAYAKEFEAEAEEMIARTMNKDAFVKSLARHIFPKPSTTDTDASKRKMTVFNDREVLLVDLFENAATNENIRGTAWAGYQSIAEYFDHYIPVQTKGATSAEDARARRTILGGNRPEKQHAFDRALAYSRR